MKQLQQLLQSINFIVLNVFTLQKCSKDSFGNFKLFWNDDWVPQSNSILGTGSIYAWNNACKLAFAKNWIAWS